MIKCSTECNLRSATLVPAEIGLGSGRRKLEMADDRDRPESLENPRGRPLFP